MPAITGTSLGISAWKLFLRVSVQSATVTPSEENDLVRMYAVCDCNKKKKNRVIMITTTIENPS